MSTGEQRPRGDRSRRRSGRSRRACRARGCAAALLLALAAAGSAPGQDSSGVAAATPGARALREIASDLQSLETFQAEFEQRQEWVGMDPSPPYRGTLYLKRPNLFRIEYREPAGHLQVSDGTKVWTWIPENGEVLVAVLENAGAGGGDLLRWVLTHSRAEAEIVSETLDDGPARRLTLQPEEGLGLTRVRLWTSPGSANVRQYEVTDAAGNVTVYRLRKTRRNPGLADDLFRFSPPDGVPVVELGAP
jgi:outer membrane lipoprotein carrier protein